MNNTTVDPLLARAQVLNLNRDPRTAVWLQHLLLRPHDLVVRTLVQEKVVQAEQTVALSSDLFLLTNPLAQGELTGAFALGVIPPNRVPWLLPPAQLAENTLLLGRSGAGKTNTILLLLCQILEVTK